MVPEISRQRTNPDQAECSSGMGSAGSSRSAATIRAGDACLNLDEDDIDGGALAPVRFVPGPPDGSAFRFSEHNLISHNEHPPVRIAHGHR